MSLCALTIVSRGIASPKATVALLAILLCTGCVASFHFTSTDQSCGETVTESDSCAPPVSEGCAEEPCGDDGFVRRTGQKLLHVVCLPCTFPYTVCARCINFCVPDDVVGPPDVMGPGRFHPVPTHPVFAPAPEPLAYPAEL